MSRTVKRVPLDFDWPRGEVWSGFLMPGSLIAVKCGACDGKGITPAARWVLATAQMLLMLDEDLEAQQRGQAMHPYFADYHTCAWGIRPSPDIREFGTGLAGRTSGGGRLGHDAVDGWVAYEKIVAAAGLDPKVWGHCTNCAGEGGIEAYPGQRAEADAWTPTEPPSGVGWQMWETVSEGSPISPVFATAEQLASWLAETGANAGAGRTATAEQWLAMIEAGSSLGSFASLNGQLMSGVEAVSQR